MITIFTQNCALINVSNFDNIMYAQDSETQEHMIVLNDKYILGRYELEDIPNIIAWIDSSIAEHSANENLCLSMPMSNLKMTEVQGENTDAKND